jgi:hypothetical protein
VKQEFLDVEYAKFVKSMTRRIKHTFGKGIHVFTFSSALCSLPLSSEMAMKSNRRSTTLSTDYNIVMKVDYEKQVAFPCRASSNCMPLFSFYRYYCDEIQPIRPGKFQSYAPVLFLDDGIHHHQITKHKRTKYASIYL